MTGITADDITITSIKSSARRLSEDFSLTSLVSLLSVKTYVAYNVTTVVESMGYDSASTAYTTLVSSLTTAISSSSFQDTLRTYASEEGSTTLTTVVADSTVIVSSPSTSVTKSASPTSRPTSLSGPSSNSYFLIIVIVCIIGGALVVTSVVLYLLRDKIWPDVDVENQVKEIPLTLEDILATVDGGRGGLRSAVSPSSHSRATSETAVISKRAIMDLGYDDGLESRYSSDGEDDYISSDVIHKWNKELALRDPRQSHQI